MKQGEGNCLPSLTITFTLTPVMPMNKEIAGESKWQIQVKLDIIGFTLFFKNIP